MEWKKNVNSVQRSYALFKLGLMKIVFFFFLLLAELLLSILSIIIYIWIYYYDFDCYYLWYVRQTTMRNIAESGISDARLSFRATSLEVADVWPLAPAMIEYSMRRHSHLRIIQIENENHAAWSREEGILKQRDESA